MSELPQGPGLAGDPQIPAGSRELSRMPVISKWLASTAVQARARVGSYAHAPTAHMSTEINQQMHWIRQVLAG